MEIWQLRNEARTFADELSAVLNGTVCDGVRVLSVIDSRTDQAVIGYQISTQDLTGRGIPLSLGKKPTAYLGMAFRLEPDDTEHKHLMVRSSFVSLCADPDLDEELIHWDYEREKADDYPEAHVQIAAESAAWATISTSCGRKGDTLASLHIPVGGRRNRPSLEDIVEFVIVERIAPARDDWRTVVAAGRERFRIKQLRAAIRRDPATARQVLDELDSN